MGAPTPGSFPMIHFPQAAPGAHTTGHVAGGRQCTASAWPFIVARNHEALHWGCRKARSPRHGTPTLDRLAHIRGTYGKMACLPCGTEKTECDMVPQNQRQQYKLTQ